MRVKLDLQLFAGAGSDGRDTTITIFSNDGLTTLATLTLTSNQAPLSVVQDGLLDVNSTRLYTYSGSDTFTGFATSSNQSTPYFAVGNTIELVWTSLYIVEQDGVPYEHIYKDNHKVQVDSAIRDGNGVKIDTNYAKKSELPDVSTKMDKANPTGTGSFSLNRKANTTIGSYSSATGNNATASGDCSHAEGSETTASGEDSHAEGYKTIASEIYSHAEGLRTTASGYGSHAEGFYTTANGDYSHAEGIGAATFGNYSHAEGYYTTAQRKSQHVFGEYNVLDTAGTTTTRGNYVEIVGKGTGDNARSNARTLDWSGNEVLAGSQTATSFIKSGGTSSQFLKADGSVDSSAYLTQHQDISGKQDKTDSSLQTTATTVVGAINEVNSLAKQSNKAKGFTNYNALITDLNSASATAYNIGQSFYIQTLNVPDLWIISVQSSSSSYTYSTDDAFITATSASGGQQVGYYKIAQLETQKVDLTNYSTKAETVSNVSFNASSRKLQKTINGSTTDVVTFGTNAFNSNTIPTRYVSSVNGLTGAITNIATLYDIPTSINGLSGGKLTSPLQISGGDAATASKIALDQTASGQITNNSTQTIFGFTSNNATNLTVGHSSYALALRGSGTRPKFNSNDMAMYSDISNTVVHDDSSAVSESTLLDNYYTKTQSDSRYIQIDQILNLIYPIGSIYMSINDVSPQNFLGGTWSKLPTGYALWTASSGAGDTISAGLPNITGGFAPWSEGTDINISAPTGAFYAESSNQYGWGTASGRDQDNAYIRFDASRSSTIYGNSSTVQPPAYKVYAWRRTA